MKAVVDRIEGDMLILINRAGQNIELKVGQFPIELHEGDHVKLWHKKGMVVRVEIDVASRQSLEKRIAKKLEILRKGIHRHP